MRDPSADQSGSVSQGNLVWAVGSLGAVGATNPVDFPQPGARSKSAITAVASHLIAKFLRGMPACSGNPTMLRGEPPDYPPGGPETRGRSGQSKTGRGEVSPAV